MLTLKKLVEQYLPLANKLAFQKKKNLPKHIDIEDLRSAAYLGLVEAANRYNPDVGVNFSTFAYPRINGAIIDYLRDLGWFKKGNSHYILSLDSSESGYECTLSDTIKAKKESNDCMEILEEISRNLDDQAKSVLKHYFIDELSMQEVGDKFGVSEGRISQLIKEYKSRICSECDKDFVFEFGRVA